MRSADHRAERRESIVLLIGVALIAACVLPGFMTASLAPQIRDDFSFGDSQLGLAVAVFYLVCALASPPCGRLVERLGAARGMRLAAALTAAGCLGVVTLTESALGLTALIATAGVGNAMAGPAVGLFFNRKIGSGRHGFAFGALQSGAPLGALLAGLALPAVAIPLGWRWGFALAGLLALGAAAPVRADRHRTAAADAAVARPPGLSSVHVLALAAVLASAAGVGFISFLVSYSVDSGIAEGPAGLLLGAVSLAAVISRLTVGALTDRSRAHPLRPVAAMLTGSVAGYLLLLGGDPGPIVAGALLVGLLGWAWPGSLTAAVVARAPTTPAWAVGVMMSGLFAGAVGGPLLVGLLADGGHFSAGWLLCAGLALAAAATVAVTERRTARPRP